MSIKTDVLKMMLGAIEMKCSSKSDIVEMLKDELNLAEGGEELNLFNIVGDKETEFHLSLACNDSYWSSALKREHEMGIDIYAYKEQVDMWNSVVPKRDKKKKRNAKGWIATARQFMKSDKEKGKLIMLNQTVDSGMMDYLKL